MKCQCTDDDSLCMFYHTIKNPDSIKPKNEFPDFDEA